MPNSYERSYQHDLDNVIDASGAGGAWGTAKESTTELVDLSGNGNIAAIKGPMPTEGFIQGRQFTAANINYLDCGNDNSLNLNSGSTIIAVFSTGSLQKMRLIDKYASLKYSYNVIININQRIEFTVYTDSHEQIVSTDRINLDEINIIICTYNSTSKIIDVKINAGTTKQFQLSSAATPNDDNLYIGGRSASPSTDPFDGILYYTKLDNLMSETEKDNAYNTLARLPIYSHNFERYPNSDTSLTSVFPYTSGIITSGSFNKTDGLKCTSAGQIIFSNSFEFDGSEYITLVIDGVEYSGTTTITQGTITATITQGSNDITIDMGTGDVLPDIRVQFREEV